MALDENALITWETLQSLLNLDTEEQSRYEKLINAASAVANRYTRRKLKARDYTIVLDGTGREDLLLPEYPVNSVTNLIIDTSRGFGPETEISDYLVYEDEAILVHESLFPSLRKSVKVIYNAGYQIVPEDLQIAVVEIIAWMASRMNDSGIGVGIRQIQTPGGGSTEYEMTIPLAAQRKLDFFIRE